MEVADDHDSSWKIACLLEVLQMVAKELCNNETERAGSDRS